MSKNSDNGNSLFWLNISYLRKKLGYSQETLAYELNITRSRLSSWEENRAMPQIMTFIRVALYFGVSMHDFVLKDFKKEGIVPIIETIKNDR